METYEFTVDCCNGSCHKMQMQVIPYVGEDTCLPCTGCKEYNDSSACMYCIAAITAMFRRGFRPEPQGKVTPDFTLLG